VVVGSPRRAPRGPPRRGRRLTAPAPDASERLGIGPLDAIAARPRLAALVGALAIAFSGIFYLWADVSPSTGTVYRALFGLPLLALVALAERRRYGPLPRRAWKYAAVAGVLFAGDLLTWHHAIEYVGAGLATVLGNLQVLIVGIVAWLVFGERPSRNTMLAVPVVLVGVVLISGVIGAGAYGSDPTLGVLISLVTALCYSGYLLLIRIGGRDARRPAGPVAIATLVTAITATGIGGIGGDLDLTPGPQSLFWLAVLGVTSQSIGYLCISISLPRLPAIITSIILLTQPVVTVGLSMILLGERPSPAQLLGVVLVIGGIAVATVPVARLRDALRTRRDAATPAG
jgi:drug/metabolite transporter (DMT)-like permease